nr:MAG TPA: hypothetical protein [Bacteriophage sp.]DAW58590.1 MAG TPA: hypothetical protein [Caudoviricetes sp.]
MHYFSQLAKHLSGRRAVRRGDLFVCTSLALLPFSHLFKNKTSAPKVQNYILL